MYLENSIIMFFILGFLEHFMYMYMYKQIQVIGHNFSIVLYKNSATCQWWWLYDLWVVLFILIVPGMASYLVWNGLDRYCSGKEWPACSPNIFIMAKKYPGSSLGHGLTLYNRKKVSKLTCYYQALGLFLEAPGNHWAHYKLFCFPFQRGVSKVLKIIQ